MFHHRTAFSSKLHVCPSYFDSSTYRCNPNRLYCFKPVHVVTVSYRFAFVYVETKADAKRAIKEIHGTKLCDTTLTVGMARQDRKRVNTEEGQGTIIF